MRKVLGTLMFLLGALLATNAYAQAAKSARPDFSGTWKLNVAKSDFGQIPPPISETDVITQGGADLKMEIKSHREQGERNYTLSLKLDGTETPTPAGAFPAESPFKIVSSTAEWDGNTLIVNQKTTWQDNPGTSKSKYTLSADGKVMTKTTDVSMQMGDFTTTSIYDKQ